MSAPWASTDTTLIMPSSPPGSLTVDLVWSVRSRLPRTKGLRSRPFPGPWAFAQAAPQAAQVRPSSALSDGGILRPSAGLLQCLHPLPVQGRPKRAVPSAARYCCVCPAQAPGAMLLSITSRHRTTCATARRKPPPPLRLPAAPAGSSKLSPASAATARRTPSATLPTFPSRLAGLVGLQRLAVQGRPNPPSRPERPTANGHLPARPRPPGTLALAKFEK